MEDIRKKPAATGLKEEDPDPFHVPRTPAMWEALAGCYRQLASGLQMARDGNEQQDEREAAGNDVAHAALKQLEALGIKCIFIQDEVDEGEPVYINRRDLAEMFRTFQMIAAFTERGRMLCLRVMRQVTAEDEARKQAAEKAETQSGSP